MSEVSTLLSFCQHATIMQTMNVFHLVTQVDTSIVLFVYRYSIEYQEEQNDICVDCAAKRKTSIIAINSPISFSI